MKALEMAGAAVKGYSLDPPTQPNHYDKLTLHIDSETGDIRDRDKLKASIEVFRPDIVFHLAAQSLVGKSYANAFETYDTNVMGTLSVLDAIRSCESVKAVVLVTTDKVYKNLERTTGYNENDELGGFDPYASSKSCSEILISSFRESFLNIRDFNQKHNTLIASARGGNVIGGGDWSEKRLIPDIIRSVYSSESLKIRKPDSIRPWQHVLDCLSGYLHLGQKLLDGQTAFSGAWNIGPENNDSLTVSEIIEMAREIWDNLQVSIEKEKFHESNVLFLDCNKAFSQLDWRPDFNARDAVKKTFEWYKAFYMEQHVITEKQISAYFGKIEQP